jgi:Tfp pilus assembly protein PilF
VSLRCFRLALFALLGSVPTGCMSLTQPSNQLVPAIPGGESSEAANRELPNRDQAKINVNLAEGMEKNGHPVEAIALYEKARQLDPKLQGKVSAHLAVLYDQLGDARRALSEYQEALKANPRDADLWNAYGYYYYTRGNWTEAETQLRQALAINAKHTRALTNLGMTLGQQQRYEESLETFAKATGRASACSNLAFILTTQGKRDEAKKYYREALQLDPTLAIARLALAKLEKPEMPTPPKDAPPAQRVPAPPTPPRPQAAATPDLSPVLVGEPVRRQRNTGS